MRRTNHNKKEALFVEKYRPRKVKDCILPKRLKIIFQAFVDKGYVDNLLLIGTHGVGKTTIAKALCEELNMEVLEINGSNEGRLIETLRHHIEAFASTRSLTGQKKVVLIDEADYMNAESVQPALRAFIESKSNNCRFILTCNYVSRLIDPLVSRFSVIDFRFIGKEKTEVGVAYNERLEQILKAEGITCDKGVVRNLILQYFPDMRKPLNELQKFGKQGHVDSEVLVTLDGDSISKLLGYMKNKEFTHIFDWVVKNPDIETATLFGLLFKRREEFFDKSSIPQMIVTLGEYQYKAAFVADPLINISACLSEIAQECEFK